MSDIHNYTFSEESFVKLRRNVYGKNWPVVYILNNKELMYIGESTRVYHRCKEHYKDPVKRKLRDLHIINDDEFNMSATKDIESWLIEYASAEGSFQLLNGNSGLSNHNYYDRERYRAKFEIIWNDLKTQKLVKKDLVQIKNSDLFKYSPYKTLTDDQLEVASQILDIDDKHTAYTQIIHGKPGTGKTILAVYIMKALVEKGKKVALVVPMVSLRKTLKAVFKNVHGLKSNMVIGPSDLVKDDYEILIVDEAHRLKRRKNITNYRVFDQVNKLKSLDKNSTELDWVFDSAHKVILFYDETQSIRPSDVRHKDFVTIDSKNYYLSSQLRVAGGEEYMRFVDNLFQNNIQDSYKIENFDFQLFDDIKEMREKIISLDKKHTLSRLVAGFAWPWISKNKGEGYDIEIDGYKMKWNSTNQGWINTTNSVYEVGCIHTVQGYDLNYVGVIIGPELSYDFKSNKFVINKKLYFDVNGHRGVSDEEELKQYILNIYKVLLTRGIKGAYVYIVDESLRKYIRKSFKHIA